MTAERWQRVKEIVGDALELERDARSAFLLRACGEDSTLRREVETLLRGDDSDAAFLELDHPPDRIGPYRIVREIGRGGMGAVYLAERADGQFEQTVAIKVIQRGLDSGAVLRRFFAERQILARLQHPNIMRLLDGGMYENRPYFVMEYLEGEPITRYCVRKEMPLAARIRLFLAVCDGVEHAHRNLILHRDLKAGNILVDTSGTPKLLDFGIAKLLADDLPVEQTAAMGPLTPQAASPEQVRGEPLTTASDVYALGILLCELLAGQPPYRVRSTSPGELVRVVCEQPVPRPSTLAAPAIVRHLRGDLDNIILKALEKDPANRYQGAAELADDLRRYLDGRPVNARTAGAAYRARKFILRHSRALAMAAIVLVAIGIAAGDAILQGRRAARRFAELRQLAGSFLFEFHDAIAPLPGSTPARELVVKRGLQYLDSLSREASNDLDLKHELAESYMRIGEAQGLYFESNLGKTADAAASFRKALALFEELARKRAGQPAEADLARARNRLASAQAIGNPPRAMALLDQIVSRLEAIARTQPLIPQAQLQLAMAYFGQSEILSHREPIGPALQARLRSIDLLRDLVTRNPADADAVRWLALSRKRAAFLYLTRLRDPQKAMEYLRAATESDEKQLESNPGSAVAKLDLAMDRAYLSAIVRRRGDLPGAHGFLEQAIAARAEVLSADPRNYRVRNFLMNDYGKLASMLLEEKRPAEAREAFRKAQKLADELEASGPVDADAAKDIAEIRRLAGGQIQPRP